MADKSLIEIETRHMILTQGHAAQIAKSVEPFLRRMDREIQGALQNVDMTEIRRERMERLLEFTQETLGSGFDDFKKTWNKQLYDFGEYQLEWEKTKLDTALGVDFVLPSRAQIVSAVRTNPLVIGGLNNGEVLSGIAETWTENNIRKVTAAIRGGYYQGLTTQQIATQIRGTASSKFRDGIWGETNRSILTLTRTAVQHVSAQAQRITYEENDNIIEGVKIVATWDEKTSELCQAMDGRVFDLADAVYPPYHPNCRTTTEPVLRGQKPLKGSMRMSKTGGKSKLVPADTNYFGWLKDQPDEVQEMAIGVNRAKLLRDGGLSAEDFSRLSLNRSFKPRTLDEMRKLEPVAFAKAFGEDDE